MSKRAGRTLVLFVAWALLLSFDAGAQTPPPRLNGIVTFYFVHLPESVPTTPETVTGWLVDGGVRKAIMGTVEVKAGDVEIQMSAAVPADEFFNHGLSAQASSRSGDWYTQLVYSVRIPQWAAPVQQGRRRPSHPPVPPTVVRRKRTVLPPTEEFPYFTVFDAMPNVNRLHAGDRVYRMTDGKFIVTANGVGLAGMPPSGSVQVWP